MVLGFWCVRAKGSVTVPLRGYSLGVLLRPYRFCMGFFGVPVAVTLKAPPQRHRNRWFRSKDSDSSFRPQPFNESSKEPLKGTPYRSRRDTLKDRKGALMVTQRSEGGANVKPGPDPVNFPVSTFVLMRPERDI